MKNSIIKQFFVIGAGTIINMLLGVITVPIITRIVSPDINGQFSLFDTYANIAVMVLCLGLDQALVRYYYKSDEQNYKTTLLYKCLFLPILISLFSLITFTFLVKYKVFNYDFGGLITVILCFYILAQLIYRFSLLVIRLESHSKLYSFLSIIIKISYIACFFLLLYTSKIDYLKKLTISITVSVLISLVLSIFFEKNIWNPKQINEEKFKISTKELLKYSVPFIFSMGIATLFDAVDKLSLDYFSTYTEIGIYTGAIYLTNVFAIIQTTFNTIWSPMSIEHYEKDNSDKKFFEDANQYITIIMFFFGLSLILLKDIFVYFLGESYREAAFILPFLLFRPIMYTISETTVCGLFFMKKTWHTVIIAAVSCLFNIVFNIILIPIIGPKGAAISTGLSYCLFFILRTHYSNKFYHIDIKPLKITIITVLMIVFALYNTFNKINLISISLYFICLILICVLYKEHINKGIKILKSHLNKTNSEKGDNLRTKI